MTPLPWEAFIDDISKCRASAGTGKDPTKVWLLQFRSIGEPLGFVFDDGEKRQEDCLDGLNLGSAIAGRDLLILPKPSRALDALGLASFAMSCPVPLPKHCEVVTGIWIFIAQYAPALMACLEEIWGVILVKTSPDRRANSLATDFLPLMALLPLCQIDLAKDTDLELPATTLQKQVEEFALAKA